MTFGCTIRYDDQTCQLLVRSAEMWSSIVTAILAWPRISIVSRAVAPGHRAFARPSNSDSLYSHHLFPTICSILPN